MRCLTIIVAVARYPAVGIVSGQYSGAVDGVCPTAMAVICAHSFRREQRDEMHVYDGTEAGRHIC